jgi:hypothetical protein
MKAANTQNDVYYKLEEMHELKVLLGGTAMQNFHVDVQVKERRKEEAEARKLAMQSNTLLLSGSLQHPIRLAVKNHYEDDRWEEIKRTFRRDRERTKAYVVNKEDKNGKYGMFRCHGMVFDGQVMHAGMPVQDWF